MKYSVPTKTVACGAAIEGPSVGYNVVAWRRYCKVPVVVPDTPGADTRCRHHSDADRLAQRRAALGVPSVPQELTAIAVDNGWNVRNEVIGATCQLSFTRGAATVEVNVTTRGTTRLAVIDNVTVWTRCKAAVVAALKAPRPGA